MRRSEAEAGPLLSLVIPAFNEEDNIRRGVLQQIADFLDGQGIHCEVIVVDDGSEDDTPNLVERFSERYPYFRLLRGQHHGKAHGVRSGMLAARGQCQLFMDMDLATSLTHIPQFLQAVQEGTDVVIASRAAKGAVRIGAPWTRYLMGKTFNYLVQALLLPGISDTQCGFKAFRKEVARDLFNNLVVFEDSAQPTEGPRVTAFDVELLVVARRRGYKIKEIPVRWRYFKTNRLSLVREPYRMFGEVIRVWLNRQRGRYGRSKEVNPTQ